MSRMRFGDWVRLRRDELGLSQSDLAKRAKVSRSTISDLELDPGIDILTDTFFKISTALKWDAQQAKNAYVGKDPNDSTEKRKKELIYQAAVEFLEKLMQLESG